MFAIAQALKDGETIEKIHELSKIDLWFLSKMKNIIDIEKAFTRLDRGVAQKSKKAGFSDRRSRPHSRRAEVRDGCEKNGYYSSRKANRHARR
jgi:hypothetical protein